MQLAWLAAFRNNAVLAGNRHGFLADLPTDAPASEAELDPLLAK